MGARLLAAATVFVAATSAAPAGAQGVEDFRVLELSAGGATLTTRPYDGRWRPATGVAARAATPFHRGRAFLALRAYANDDPSEQLPDFLAVHGTAGWGPIVALPRGIRLNPSAHIGAVMFRFSDENEFQGALRDETEIETGIAARVEVPVAWRAYVWVGADALRVFTTPRTDLLFVEAGLGISLASPSWLRRGLR